MEFLPIFIESRHAPKIGAMTRLPSPKFSPNKSFTAASYSSVQGIVWFILNASRDKWFQCARSSSVVCSKSTISNSQSILPYFTLARISSSAFSNVTFVVPALSKIVTSPLTLPKWTREKCSPFCSYKITRLCRGGQYAMSPTS